MSILYESEQEAGGVANTIGPAVRSSSGPGNKRRWQAHIKFNGVSYSPPRCLTFEATKRATAQVVRDIRIFVGVFVSGFLHSTPFSPSVFVHLLRGFVLVLLGSAPLLNGHQN